MPRKLRPGGDNLPALTSFVSVQLSDPPYLCPQSWTNKCIFAHDVTTLRKLGYGENLAVVNGPPSYDVFTTGISGWADEASLYNFAAPGYSDATGHFTCAHCRTAAPH